MDYFQLMTFAQVCKLIFSHITKVVSMPFPCLLDDLLSDIYGAVDLSQVTLVALFNVCAASDTVDHNILVYFFCSL
jgi:hypothetical protein